jgi:hypothetical protein
MARLDFWDDDGWALSSQMQMEGHSLLFESKQMHESPGRLNPARLGREKALPKKVTRKIRRHSDGQYSVWST